MSGGHNVKSRIDRPGAREKFRMRLASINDAFKLGVRQDSIYDQTRRQMRPIGWLRRCNGGHCRRLNELSRMRMRSGKTDRLQSISLIKRIGEPDAFRRSPLDRL